MALTVVSLPDEDGVPILGGDLDWVPLRRRLGIRAFGTNYYRAARAGDLVIEEHVESPGQEEIYVVLTGRMRFTAGEETAEVAAGGVAYVADPETKRGATALEDGTSVLAVGGWVDKPYRPLPWEPIFLANEAMTAGDWAGAAEILEREAGEHREHPFVRYRLASCLAKAGAADRAREELAAAIEANPDLAERAAADADLAPLL
jgi:hypothetical protein